MKEPISPYQNETIKRRTLGASLLIAATGFGLLLSTGWALLLVGFLMAPVTATAPVPGIETAAAQPVQAAVPVANSALALCDRDSACSWQRCLHVPLSSGRIELLQHKIARLCLGVENAFVYGSFGLSEEDDGVSLASPTPDSKIMVKLWSGRYLLRR